MNISDRLNLEIASTKQELEAKLAEVEAASQLMSNAAILRPRLRRLLHWDVLEDYEKQLVDNFVELQDTNSQTLHASLIVICYGSLESFMKALVERSIIAINGGCDDVGKIPRSILDENIARTGRVLATAKDGRTNTSYDYIELARSLGSCSTGNTEFLLNASCFWFGQGIVSPMGIEKALEAVGVKISWDAFGRDRVIRRVFEENGTRRCGKAVRSAVEDLVKMRNVVAHTGSLDQVVSRAEISKLTSFLPPFCSVLVQEVGKQLDNNCG